MLSIVSNLINKVKQDAYWLTLIAISFALSTAYLAEFIWELHPCMLCIYQRIPYLILVVSSLIAILFPKTQKNISFIIVLLFISEISIAIYHVGVEHYIIEDSYTCQISSDIVSKLGSLLSVKEVASSCSDVKFKFMNFSMAEWNVFYASALLFCFFKLERKNGHFTW